MAPILPLKITHPVCWAELYLKISKHTKEMFTARLFRTRPGPHASIFRRPACRSITRHGYVFVSRDHLGSDSFDERFLAWYPKIFNYISRASWKPVQVQNKRVLLNSRRKLIRFFIFFIFFYLSLLTDRNSSLVADTHIYLPLSKCVWVDATTFPSERSSNSVSDVLVLIHFL